MYIYIYTYLYMNIDMYIYIYTHHIHIMNVYVYVCIYIYMICYVYWSLLLVCWFRAASEAIVFKGAATKRCFYCLYLNVATIATLKKSSQRDPPVGPGLLRLPLELVWTDLFGVMSQMLSGSWRWHVWHVTFALWRSKTDSPKSSMWI